MKISFITTVYNETNTILSFLNSILEQSSIPDEIIIVDGGSTDDTLAIMRQFKSKVKNKKVNIKILMKRGNRSVGRNEAIRNADGDVIVCSDSGNTLHKDWVKNIIKPFSDKNVDVVAGYYKGDTKNIFQKCVVPFALVMPDKIDPKHFLPATRSVAFKKAIWKKVGGFEEQYSHNEDYVFARKLKQTGAKIVFAKNAIVNWTPRNTYKQFFIMLYRFALGDAEAHILRSKVILLFARYFFGLYLLFLCLLYRSTTAIAVLTLFVVAYVIWSIHKNYRYIKHKNALYILPLLQITADAAVISGTLYGLIKSIKTINVMALLKNNLGFVFLSVFYILVLFLTLGWGIPNENHPFPYHMDEWHQLHAIGTTFRDGTPNTEGSANGTMLHFIISGFYLIPFTLVQYVNPFELQIDNLFMRERIFEVLRIQTIVFGVLSMVLFYKIVKKLKAPKSLALILFTLTPLWLMLSGYFKYDIALMFFILLALLALLSYTRNPSSMKYSLAGVASGLAIAVKVSALPLIAIYLLAYFLFSKSWKYDIKYLILGLILLFTTVLLFGLPDTLFGKGNIVSYLYDNLLVTPKGSFNMNLNMHPLVYLFTRHYPLVFGYGLISLFIFSSFYWIYFFIQAFLKKELQNHKLEVFIILSFGAFFVSILPLQLLAGGNRSLVLLPFMVLMIILAFNRIAAVKNLQVLSSIIIILAIVTQIYQSFAWIAIKWADSPQIVASKWIEKNFKENTLIGLENIPIYQMLPELLQKEFYFNQYSKTHDQKYRYKIVNSTNNPLPSVIIITNGEIENELLLQSPKKELIERLQREGYKKVAVFSPDLTYFRLFGNDTDYYLSGLLVASPLSTSVFEK